MRNQMPTEDTYRFETYRVDTLRAKYNTTVHTHADCPYLDQGSNIKIHQPGEATPDRLDTYCSWCQDHVIYPGRFADPDDDTTRGTIADGGEN